MDNWIGVGWIWVIFGAAAIGLLYQIVLELKGIRKQLEVFIKLRFPHIFDKD